MNYPEYWTWVKGSGNYVVSSRGRLFSYKSERLLKGYIHESNLGNQYRRFSIDGKRVMVHVLVASHFYIDPYGEIKAFTEKTSLYIRNMSFSVVVDHIDNMTLNNTITNLQWVSVSENTLRANANHYKKSIKENLI